MLTQVCLGQVDSTLYNLQNIPNKYFKEVDHKIEKYQSRITKKTIQTLEKLSRWENKIRKLLEGVSPETAGRLFTIGQPTFASILQQLKDGEELVLSYQAPYNKYRDDLTTTLKYVQQAKEYLDTGLIKKAVNTKDKMLELTEHENQAEVLQQFIKERKKQLIEQAVQHIGQSKYLQKINKEAFYYVETLKNYKEIFSDSRKAESTVKDIVTKIPAFQKFMQKNGELASLFGQAPDNANSGSNTNLIGLQTRSSVQTLIQDQIASGGPNAEQIFRDNIQQGQAELMKLKDKLLTSMGNSGGDINMPSFKPNMQKTKTFLQRLEYGFNVQFAKNNTLLPTTSDIAGSVGYKLNDKSIIGVGASYKLGLGSIQAIHLSHEGVGIRSFLEWKLKKQFFISGGYELNHNAQFQNIAQLKNYNMWQSSALLGLTKKTNIKTKFFKSTNFQILFDFLSKRHDPVSQPVLFRVGYTL
jgi:hypothetical protein